MFDLDQFIAKYVTFRSQSMFLQDIELNSEILAQKIEGKSVLVIGGAGTIGSSFVKAILPFRPSVLVIADINENALAELTRDLRSTEDMYIPEDYMPYPMDFASSVFQKMFRKRGGFNIVANFSAHKHVRSEKDIYSIEALLRNNVLNAKAFLDLLSEFPPEEYFCVSTDKAANPVNIMGASKRIMEELIFSYSDKFPVKTARFANVAFSDGSLPAGFLERIQKRQPLSAPLDVKRYFVSPEESGQICLMACALGENREIFFPKLHSQQMITFDWIATKLLQEHGYEIQKCHSEKEAVKKSESLKFGGNQYPVYYSYSDTSGEKMYEEFFTNEEVINTNKFYALGVIVGKRVTDGEKINRLLKDLETEFGNEAVTKEKILWIIQTYLPGFSHIETGKSLDSKM